MARGSADDGQIFLSYSRKDSPLVSDLAGALAARGYATWLDVEEIHAGRVWREEIVNSIETCAAFVLILSENSALSENVIKELSLAESSGRHLFPVVIGGAGIPPRMKYQLAGLQFVEIGAGDPDAGIAQLLRGFEEAGLAPRSGAVSTAQAEAGFVGCQRELTKLDEILASALKGRARPAIITGEAGSGKSALISAFQRQAQQTHPDLIVAFGGFSPETDYANPYQPWIEILRQFTGDVEVPTAHGHLTAELANRLRTLAPEGLAVLLDHAPGLVGDFISGALLRAQAGAHGTDKTGDVEAQIVAAEAIRPADQAAICREFSAVVEAIAARHPVLLVLDDMQWADAPSLDLLTHVLSALDRSPVLILGACAPTELQTGPGEAPHPLMVRLDQFKRRNRDLWIDLDAQGAADHRGFVSDLIDTQPNLLDDAFREALFTHTGGNPLFTTELLRSLQDRGILVKDAEGRWIIGAELDWDDLPAEVEGVVEERIGALEDDMRQLLAIASVEGENFTAQVIARVQELHERDLIRDLSRELDKRHRLVREVGAERLKNQILSHFAFKHALLQRFLYDDLGSSEKLILHGEIAEILETLYEGDIDRIAFQLARHYDLAGIQDKAIEYLTRAGRRAARMSAYGAAAKALARAVELVRDLPAGDARDQQELDLQIMLSAVVKVLNGWDSPEVIAVYQEARRLCTRIGPTEKFAPVLFGFWVVKLVRLDLDDALVLAEELRQLGESLPSEDVVMQACIALGNTHFWLGNLRDCLEMTERVYALYDPARFDAHIENYGQDPRALALMFSTLAAGLLGEEALAAKREAELTSLIDALDHPFSQAIALQGVAWHRFHRGELGPVRENAQKLVALSNEHDFGFYKGVGLMFEGWAEGRSGETASGCAKIEAGYHNWIAVAGGSLFHSLYALLVADIQFRSGDLAEGIEVVQRGLARAERQNERCYEAELHRRVGETLRSRLPSCPDAALACFTRAREIAQGQASIFFELRAALSLGQMLAANGDEDGARALVEESRNRFPGSALTELPILEATGRFLARLGPH